MAVQELTEKQRKKAEANRKYREKQKANKSDERQTLESALVRAGELDRSTRRDGVSAPEGLVPTRHSDSSPPDLLIDLGLEPVPETEPVTTGKTAKKPKAPRKVSALDAAHQVLSASPKEMTVGELIEAMTEQKLWTSPNGKTPAATLSAAILREIANKGRQSRFKKVAPGRFEARALPKGD